MVPSRRLYLLLLLGIPTAPIITGIWGLWGAIAVTGLFDGIVLLFAIWDSYRVKSQRVQVVRAPLKRLSVGRDNPVVISVRSPGTRVRLYLQDGYPAYFPVSTQTFQITLEPNSTQELIYTVCPNQRGAFNWGDIQVRQLSPWQLAWHDWQVPASQKVAVYPDLVGLRALSLRLTLENTGTMRQARRLGMGTEFAELREYRQGDDPRVIDWKATARRSRPVVRVLEPEKEQTLIILLDRGRLMTVQVQGLKRFDWGLNAALSLALAGLHRGDRVGVGVFDRQITTWIPPARGQQRLAHLIERLTPLQPVLLEPDYVGAVTQVVNQQTRRALVVLITDIVDVTASAELLAALGRLTPRYLPFCVTLRDPLVDKIARNASERGIEAAYTRAVALDLLAQRQAAFAQLRQQGVLVLDAPADCISEQLVNRYLQLKARNLL